MLRQPTEGGSEGDSWLHLRHDRGPRVTQVLVTVLTIIQAGENRSHQTNKYHLKLKLVIIVIAVLAMIQIPLKCDNVPPLMLEYNHHSVLSYWRQTLIGTLPCPP